MNNYEYPNQFKALWEHAVAEYGKGNREPGTYFNPEQFEYMANNGLKVMDLYDFAEDFVSGGEPDFETFLLIHAARRDYFLAEQKGVASDVEIDMDTLPQKSEAVDGIVWLPRILPKAKAKLKGELSADIMYSCGGDRRFFKQNNVNAADFLRVVWANMDDDAKTVEWVKQQAES